MDRVDGILGTGIVGTCVSRRKLAPTERGGARYMCIDGRVVPGKLLPSVEDVVAMCDDAGDDSIDEPCESDLPD